MEEAKQPCPKRRFRARLFAGVGLLLLAVYSLLWGAASLWLHGVQRQIASTGLALTAADVIPMPPPDEENPAVTLEKAYTLLRPSPDDGLLGEILELAKNQREGKGTPEDWTTLCGHLEQPRVKQAIALMLTAGSFDAHVPKLDYVGPNTQLPHLARIRAYCFLLSAEALRLAKAEPMRASLGYCFRCTLRCEGPGFRAICDQPACPPSLH